MGKYSGRDIGDVSVIERQRGGVHRRPLGSRKRSHLTARVFPF
jgi:hypothetical protein